MPSSNLLSYIAVSQVQPGLVKLHLWSAYGVSRRVVWPCVITMCYKGKWRGREDTQDPSELLRVSFFGDLWLVAVRDGMINCIKQELNFLISLLSIYLPFFVASSSYYLVCKLSDWLWARILRIMLSWSIMITWALTCMSMDMSDHSFLVSLINNDLMDCHKI